MVSAPASAQQRLLELQRVDTALAQAEHRRQNLPEAKEREQVAVTLGERQSELARARTRAHDASLAAAKADADVEQVRNRRDRDQQRLDAGQGSAKDLGNLIHELESLAQRQSDLEDAELEAMEAVEEAQAAVDALEREVAALGEKRDALTRTLGEATAGLDSTVAGLTAQRATVLPDVPEALLTLYDRIRQSASGAGIGAAALQDGRCSGCRMSMSPTELSRVNGLPADEVARCEECRRILVRVPA